MRVIFLDIDGVILPVGAYNEIEVRDIIAMPRLRLPALAERAPSACVTLIKTLVDETEAKLVLISSWRGVFAEDALDLFFDRLGLRERFHSDWLAPMQGLPQRPVKGRDIRHWLSEHRAYRQRDCLVIDDDDLALRERWGFGALLQIKTISDVGFSRDDLARSLKIVQRHGAQKQPRDPV